ncbi:MAG: cation-efflux pump [Deltaproteobacteria bacterium HGW-Deltaproteobacteria-17]|nr:MAG: cation-efflux pump [Deltaproteobacteria bacterium HGW-Deltaproteobacteria-17]
MSADTPETTKCPPDRVSRANRVTLLGSLVNAILTGLKLAAGILGNSAAMIADAIHSLSDFATDLVVLITMRITRQPMDADHDYGHGKFETLATMIIGVALLLVGAGIGWSGVKTVHAASHGATVPEPHFIALIAAFVSILSKEALYQWTVLVGREIQSQAVIANAWHHRSDALSSIGTLVGIGGAILLGDRFTILDPIASIVVSFFIIRVALQISYGSMSEMLERSLPPEEKDRLLKLALTVDGVMDPHNLRTRRIGNYIATELHIRVKSELSVIEGHRIASEVERLICTTYGEGTIVSVHVEPEDED